MDGIDSLHVAHLLPSPDKDGGIAWSDKMLELKLYNELLSAPAQMSNNNNLTYNARYLL